MINIPYQHLLDTQSALCFCVFLYSLVAYITHGKKWKEAERLINKGGGGSFQVLNELHFGFAKFWLLIAVVSCLTAFYY